MRTAKLISIASLVFLGGCTSEKVGYFTCSYGPLSDRFSLVIDKERKTILFQGRKERGYEEVETDLLVSRDQDDNRNIDTLEFNRITGQFRVLYDYTTDAGNPMQHVLRYQCEKTQRLM